MKSNSKQAKFFCESCGAEVNANAKFCTTCGKFFAAVRCPNCGKTGTTKEFESGCPQCGYAVGKNKKNIEIINNDSKNLSGFRKLFLKKRNFSNKNSESLPFWVYVLSILALIGVLVCVYSCL